MIKKAIDKNQVDKLINLTIDLKTEIESHTGICIDLDNQIDIIEKEIKKKNAKVPKKNLKN